MCFPLVVLYRDRMFPETVNKAQELRHSVGFRVIASFRGVDTEVELDRVKYGWRMSDAHRFVIDSSRISAVRQFFASVT